MAYTVCSSAGFELAEYENDREAIRRATSLSKVAGLRIYVKLSEDDIIFDTSKRVAVNSVGSYYAPDGTLMNADETRSIFDDVDL